MMSPSDPVPQQQTLAMLHHQVAKLQAANEALQAKVNQLERFIQTAPTGIGIVSERVIQQANDCICEITGYTDTELVGQSARMLYPTDIDFEYVGSTKYDQIRKHGTGAVETRWQRKDGQIIDVLLSLTPLHFDDLASGVTFAAHDITARKRAEEAQALQARKLTALYETALEITTQRDLPTLLSAIVERAADLLNTRMGGLYLVDADDHMLELVVSHNLPDGYVGNRLQFGQGIAGRVAQTGNPLTVSNYHEWEDRATRFDDYAFRRVLGVPLKAGEHLIGVLAVTDEVQAYSFTEDEVRLAQMFADQAAIAINNARLYETSQRELTERQWAEAALKKSEEKFSKVFHASPLAISLIRLSDERYVNVNESYLRATGYKREEIIGRTTKALGIWDDPEDNERIADLLKTTGSIRFLECRLRKKSGELLIAKLSLEIIEIDGEAQILNVAENITQQKLAEAALRESEQLYRSLIDVIPEGVALSDLSGNIRFVSPQLLDIYDSSSAEGAIGSNAVQWIAPESRDKALTNIQRLAKKEVTDDNEYILLKQDGTRFYGEIMGAVLTDDSEKPTGLVTVHRDITERIEMQNALRANEARYRRLAENGPDIIFRYILHPTPHLEFINQTVETITGYTPEECYADPRLMINMAHPDDAHIMANLVQTLGPFDKPIMMRWVGKDGTVRWMESRIVPVCNAEGQTIEVEGITRDITERKKAEDQIRDALQEKEALLREVHHRVKNNLAVICALLDLQSEDVADKQSQAAFQESRNRIRSMAYIHDQLTYAENLAQINVLAYIEELVNSLRLVYSLDPIDIKIDVSDVTLPFDLVSPCGLLINELVSNAMKHAFPPQRTSSQNNAILIALHALADDNTKVALIVSDNGIGLPADIDLTKATSLGLTLVQLLVNQLNGTLDIVREKGTTFRVVFEAQPRRQHNG